MPALSLINCGDWVRISLVSSNPILDRKELVEAPTISLVLRPYVKLVVKTIKSFCLAWHEGRRGPGTRSCKLRQLPRPHALE